MKAGSWQGKGAGCIKTSQGGHHNTAWVYSGRLDSALLKRSIDGIRVTVPTTHLDYNLD